MTTDKKPLRSTRSYDPKDKDECQLSVEQVMQADQSCDLDLFTGASGSVVDRESH